jgi:hypothetical protein
MALAGASCGGGSGGVPDGGQAASDSGTDGPPGAGAVDLRPAADLTLPGGAHRFTSVSVPAGVTVTFAAAATVEVEGDVTFAGAVRADCAALAVRAQGALRVLGIVDNRCSSPSSAPGDLLLETREGQKLELGSPTPRPSRPGRSTSRARCDPRRRGLPSARRGRAMSSPCRAARSASTPRPPIPMVGR